MRRSPFRRVASTLLSVTSGSSAPRAEMAVPQHVHGDARPSRCLSARRSRAGSSRLLRRYSSISWSWLRVGELSVQEEVDHLFQRGLRGKVVDVVAAVEELAHRAVDETRSRPVKVNAGQAAMELYVSFHHGSLFVPSGSGMPN